MNSSDEDKDKLLSKHLQHVFSDFEHDPPPGTGRPIWQAIPRRTAVYRWLAVGSMVLLVLVGAGLYVMSPERGAHGSEYGRLGTHRVDRHKHSAPYGLRKRGRTTEQNRVYSGQTYPDGNTPDRSRLAGQPAVQPIGERVKFAQGKTVRPGRERSQPARAVIGWLAQKVSKRTTRHSMNKPTASATGPIAAAAESVAGEYRNVQPVAPISYATLRERSIQSKRSVYWPLTLAASATVDRKSLSVRPRVFFGVTPVSSYQRMTIVNTPETYVQHVAAPSAFAASTWGYQVSGGIEWKQTTIQLSAGTIRRWAYYGVADGRFSVTPAETNQYEVRRLDQPVAESESLRLLSAGMSQQIRVGRAHSPYFTRLGGSASYVPATGQSLAWVTASAGLTLPVANTYQLQVGPTLEYGLSRLWSNERQLIIYPYLVGVTLSLHTQRP